jgi:hypothetical protein
MLTGIVALSLQALNAFNPAKYGALLHDKYIFPLSEWFLGAMLIDKRPNWCTGAHVG